MNETSANEPFQDDDSPRTSTSSTTTDSTGTGTGSGTGSAPDNGNGNGNGTGGRGYGQRFTSHIPLRRAYHGRMLAGVAAGMADYLGVDVTIVRVVFVVATLMGGAGIPLYLACLLLIPEEGADTSIATSLLDSITH